MRSLPQTLEGIAISSKCRFFQPFLPCLSLKHTSQLKMSLVIALLCREKKPMLRPLFVSTTAVSFFVAKTKPVLGMGAPFFRCSLE